MAPAAASNWLSFSLSPMEMLASGTHHHHDQTPQISLPSTIPGSQHYNTFFDTFYSNDWANPKTQGMYMDTPTTVPKLEDFLGGDSADTAAATQDESSSQLTHLYDPHHSASNYFPDHHHQHHHSVAANGYHSSPAAAANSGSEVDDSGPTQLSCGGSHHEFAGQSIESELVAGFTTAAAASAVNGGSLSLGVVASRNSEKALVTVAVEADSSAKKISDTFGQRTSIYRGVTRHRWTGRYEAHLWDNSCRREGQARKGRQVYLGGYDKEDKAARAYDLAALKYWGPTATTNFPISNYTKELEEMKNVTKQEFIASLRRKSSGFSRGASIYRGVTRHHQQGRWQARIGRVAGNKDLYLGTFATEEEAAEAYDIAAIKFRGVNAVTNFEMSRYNVEAILNSNLPVGGAAKRLKLATAEPTNQGSALSLDMAPDHQQSLSQSSTAGTINFATPVTSCNVNFPFDSATAAIFHQNLLHNLRAHGNAAGAGGGVQLAAAPEAFPMALMPQASSEFYIWPHQSY